MDDIRQQQARKVERMLKIGIVGLGNAASMILPALNENPHAAVAGVADLRPGARGDVGADYGIQAFASIEEPARADIDAIWIATPNQFHAEQAVIAANAGKHIICEKPMAVTPAECGRLI